MGAVSVAADEMRGYVCGPRCAAEACCGIHLGVCRSGQTGRIVNPLAYAYGGSNPSAPIDEKRPITSVVGRFVVLGWVGVHCVLGRCARGFWVGRFLNEGVGWQDLRDERGKV